MPDSVDSSLMLYDMSEPTIDVKAEGLNESVADRPILSELRDRILACLPGVVHRIVLFGSQARGDFDESSDVDVLVVLDNCTPSVLEQARAARYEVMEQRGFQPLISLLLLSEQEWQDLGAHSAGLKHNIEREGLTIWPTT